MLCSIDNDVTRLNMTGPFPPEFKPFVVHISTTERSRDPIMVRRRTLREAQIFVEDVTGVSAHLWVHNGGRNYKGRVTTIHSFTGPHRKKHADTNQYQPADLEEFARTPGFEPPDGPAVCQRLAAALQRLEGCIGWRDDLRRWVLLDESWAFHGGPGGTGALTDARLALKAAGYSNSTGV